MMSQVLAVLAAAVNQNSTTIQIPAGVQIQGIVTDPFTWIWLTLWSIAGPLVMLSFIGLLAWYIYDQKVRTPLESNIVKECSLKKRPLSILEGDSGYLEFKAIKRLGPEGAARTKEEGAGEQKTHWTGFFARSSAMQQLKPTEDAAEEQRKAIEITNELAKQLGEASIERRYLKGAKVPVSVGYSGKAILTNIKSIATLKSLEVLSKIETEFPTYVSLSIVKSLFSQQWNESQVTANEDDREKVGFLKAKKFGGKDSIIMILVAIGIFFGGLAALIAVAYFFGR